MELHEAALRGEGGDMEDFDEYIKKYAGLWKVSVKDGTVMCECRSYWHSLTCPHVLVHQHVLAESTYLSVALSQVPKVGLNKARKVTGGRYKRSKAAMRKKVNCKHVCYMRLFHNATFESWSRISAFLSIISVT